MLRFHKRSLELEREIKRAISEDSVSRMQRQHARKQADRPGRQTRLQLRGRVHAQREQCYSFGGEYTHKENNATVAGESTRIKRTMLQLRGRVHAQREQCYSCDGEYMHKENNSTVAGESTRTKRTMLQLR